MKQRLLTISVNTRYRVVFACLYWISRGISCGLESGHPVVRVCLLLVIMMLPTRALSPSLLWPLICVAVVVVAVIVVVYGLRFCGHHCHCLWTSLLWPSFFGHHCCCCHFHGLWPSLFVAVIICGHHFCCRHCHGLWPSLFLAVIICGHGCHGLWPSFICGRLVSNSQVIGCEDRLQNDLYCVGWGVKLYSIYNVAVFFKPK